MSSKCWFINVVFLCLVVLAVLTVSSCREGMDAIVGPPAPQPTPAPTMSPSAGQVPTPIPTPTPRPTAAPTTGPNPTVTPIPGKELEGVWTGMAIDNYASGEAGCDMIGHPISITITQNGPSLTLTMVTQHNGLDPLKGGTTVPGTYESALGTIKVEGASVLHDVVLETHIDLDGVVMDFKRIIGTFTVTICDNDRGVCFCTHKGDLTLTKQ